MNFWSTCKFVHKVARGSTIHALMESYKNNLSETESHLSDFKPSEMWSYFLRPRTILLAKFWTNCSLFTLVLGVLLHKVEQ